MKQPGQFLLCALLLTALWQMHHAFVTSVDARTSRQAVPLAKPLSSVPFSLGKWNGKTVELSEDVEEVSGADEYIRRDYFHFDQQSSDAMPPVALYMTYYGGLHRTIPHGPGTCYPMGGWSTLDHSLIETGGTPAYHRYVFRKEVDEHLVIYWYYVNGKRLAGASATRLDFARNILSGSKGSIVQVQLAVPIGDSPTATTATAAVQDFRTEIEPVVHKLLKDNDLN